MKKVLCVVALLAMLGAPAAASAQLTVGPLAGFHDDNINFGIGAFASIPLPQLTEGFAVAPSFVYFFPDDPLDFWELNGDAIYAFQVSEDTPVLPFVLAGLNIAHVGSSVTVPGLGTFGGSSTDIGLNLGGGIGFRAASVQPFAGAKIEIQDASGFVIFGGVGFALGS